MMENFPSYATIDLEGFSEQRASAILRTEMESGPPKQAKIVSRVMVTRPVTIRFENKADYLSFLSWFSQSINEGADWFNWFDSVSRTTRQARFSGSALEGSPAGAVSQSWVIRGLKLETWG